MKKCKHNICKELWLNRPWVYIPDVISFMKSYPYNKKTDYFFVWFWNCLYCNWQVVWKV